MAKTQKRPRSLSVRGQASGSSSRGICFLPSFLSFAVRRMVALRVIFLPVIFRLLCLVLPATSPYEPVGLVCLQGPEGAVQARR